MGIAVAILLNGAINASAQTWTDVTSTYLANADLSTGSGTGWTKTGTWADGSGTANGTVYVSENYSGWDPQTQTNFALTQPITLPAGLYKIDAYALYRGTVGNVLLSAASASTTLGSVAVASAGDISSTGSNDLEKAANSFNSNYNYLNTVYFYLSANTTVTIGYVGTHTEKQQWFVAGPMKLYKYADDSTISSSATLDFTSMIFNPDFESGNTDGWTTTASSDTGARSTTNNTYKMSNSNGNYLFNTWWKGTPCTQELAYLPAGQYELSSVVASDGATIYLINGDDTNDYAYTETTDNTVGITLTKSFLLTSNASNYKIGVVGGADGTAGEHKAYQADGYWWYKCDNFKLTYKGNGVEHYATTQSGDAAADTWYAQEITVAGSYTLTTNGTATIVYTQNPALEPANVTTSASNGDALTLAVGTIYYKASAATSLTIAPPSYTYTVGSATVDYEYVQGGETVTVTFNAATNNTSATFAKNGNPTITFGGNPISVNTTSNGFTFTVPAVTAGTSYTLSIPANAFGYAANGTYNAAQEITINAPVLFDGTYYLKVAATTTDRTTNSTATGTVGKYLARGNAYGTHATVDNYGLAINVTTDKDNFTTLQAYDTKRYYFTTGSYDVYADGTGGTEENQKFVISTNQGKLLIAGKTSQSVFFKHNNGDANNASASIFFDGNGTNSGPIILWEVENPTQHQTIMTARKNAQAGTAAAAAFDGDADTYASLSSVTTKDALESAVESMYSKVVSPVVTTTGIQEKYQGTQPGKGNTMETVYSAELTIPAQGLYKFSMQAFYRSASNEVTQDMHSNNVDCPPVFLFLGDYETQIKSLYDETGLQQSEYENETVGGAPVEYNGTYYTNGQHNSEIVFSKGLYNNDVWAYFPAAGTYTYGVKYTGFANANMQWFIYYPQSVTVTYYGSDDSRFDKLNAEIAKAEAINGVWNNSDLADEITTAQAMYTAYTANLTAVNDEIDALKAKYPTSVAVSNGNFDTNPVLLADGTTASGANQVVSTNGTLYDVTGFSSSESGSEWVYGLNAEYGSTGTLNNVTPPATDIYGEASGAALGLSAGWSHNTVYSQDVTIANAGRYLIYYEAFNKNSVATISGNKIGLDGTYSDKVDGFTENQWVRDVFVVDIYEAGTYPLTVGIYGEGGSGSNAKLWVDNVEIYRVGDAVASIQTADGIVTVLGGNTLADINAALTNTISVLNLEKATGLSSAAISTANNPNLLIYAKNGSQVSNTKNVIVGGTCSTLELQKSNANFFVPTAFTATNAKYIVANGDLAGGSFATLMIPFEATTLPGTAYALNQGVDVMGGTMRGTTVSPIAANSPVLVTKAGDYTATNAAIPAIASGATYTNGELVGVYQSTTAPEGSYVLQNHTGGEGVAFYIVGSTKPTVNPFRAYIKSQTAGARALFFLMEEEITGINTISNEESVTGKAEAYDLQGRRTKNLKRGMYIINGKKIIIK